ncbi:hypothetical protein SAMN06272765_7262 [Streptomyces sp. Ag109_G2-15]|nr:hypothetical protein SAMN06272765_7262 [Streptomyces sp. Ag109_G2-15]
MSHGRASQGPRRFESCPLRQNVSGYVPQKIRATAGWIETAAATGQVVLDEQLARLLRGR